MSEKISSHEYSLSAILIILVRWKNEMNFAKKIIKRVYRNKFISQHANKIELSQ